MEEASESGVEGHTQLHSKSEVSLEYRKHVSKKKNEKRYVFAGDNLYSLLYPGSLESSVETLLLLFCLFC